MNSPYSHSFSPVTLKLMSTGEPPKGKEPHFTWLHRLPARRPGNGGPANGRLEGRYQQARVQERKSFFRGLLASSPRKWWQCLWLTRELMSIGRRLEGSPFFAACQFGYREMVLQLLANERVDVNKPQNIGSTPFNIAYEKDHKDVVALLLADTRIDVNKPRYIGVTPFYIACRNGHKSQGK